MRVKESIMAAMLFIAAPVLIVFVYSIILPCFEVESWASKNIVQVDIAELIAENRDPGKEGAYTNAMRFLEYAKYGSGYSKEGLTNELKTYGYLDDEINYALSKIKESDYVDQIVQMINKYRNDGVILTKEDAKDMWLSQGFTEDEINKAFKKSGGQD